MGFSVDHNDVYSDNLIAEGKYEFLIHNSYFDVTKSGAECICLDLVVRNDVDQKYQNKHIWYQSWKRKNPDEKCIEGYSRQDINAISKAAALQNGKSYNDLEEWMDDLKGKVVGATVYHDTYKDSTYNKVRYFYPSSHPNCTHEVKGKPGGYVNIEYEEEDLPF